MKTVYEFIRTLMITRRNKQLECLIRFKAPDFIINTEKSIIARLENREFKLNKTMNICENYLVVGHEQKMGNGGKKYYEIKTTQDTVLFFPNAAFGPFVALKK